jgi:hypothetical protein
LARIFRLKGVQNARFPSSLDFQYAGGRLRSACQRLPGFMGGVLYGSVVAGHHSPASDMDFFFAYEGLESEVAVAIAELVQDIDSSFSVELSWHGAPISQLFSIPSVSLSPGMYRHLLDVTSRYQKSVIGENPLQFVNSDLLQISPVDELRRYLEETRLKLLKRSAAVTFSDEWYDLHRIILDRPVHAVRRYLEWKEVSLGNNSMYTVTGLFLDQLRRSEVQSGVLLETARALFQAKLDYVAGINAIINLPPDQSNTRTHLYLETLHKVRQQGDALSDFTAEMLELL